MTSVSTNVSSFVIKAPKFSYNILGVTNNPNITYSNNLNTAYYYFNTSLSGNDSLTFSDTIQIETGCVQGTSIASRIEVLWGCGGNYCDSNFVVAEGNMISPSPVPSIIYLSSGHLNSSNNTINTGYSFCEENFVEFELKNNSMGDPIAGAMFDIDIEFGAQGNNPFQNANLIYDSVTINGQPINFSAGSTLGRRIIDTLSPPYSGGGVTNLNGDNIPNDIQPGGTLIIRYYFKISSLNIPSGDTCFNNTSKTFWHERMWINVNYKNICDETSSISNFHNTGGGFGLQMILGANSMLYLQGAEDSLFSITLSETWRDRGVNDSKVLYSHRFIVPNYVNVDNYLLMQSTKRLRTVT